MNNIKVWMLACLMLALAFSGCNTNSNKEPKEEPKKEILHVLAYWELKGPVKTCDEVEFDSVGRMIRLGDYNPFVINEPYREVDEEGYMEEFSQWQRNEAGEISAIVGIEGMSMFTWKDGKVVHSEGYQEGSVYAADYEYDAKGHLVKLTEYLADELEAEKGGEMPMWATTQYNYIDIDNHGNWIRRQVTRTYPDSDIFEDYEETREITYFK